MFKGVFKIALICLIFVAVVKGTSLRGERPEGERPEKINNELKEITAEEEAEHKVLDMEAGNQAEKAGHIDHCHTTNKVREVLCPKCNKALGSLNEDPQRIAGLIQYIAIHSEVS